MSDNLDIGITYTVEVGNRYVDMNLTEFMKHKEHIINIKIIDNKIVYTGEKAKVVLLTEKQLKYPGGCIEGVNDLYSYAKRNNKEYLINEFNDDICNIHKIAYSSNKKVRWKCEECQHTWEAVVASRTNSNTMCPQCNNGKATSINEQLIYLALKNKHEDTISRQKITLGEKQFEVDIMNYTLGIFIDYRGAYSHKFDRSLKRDREFEYKCRDNGINLIIINEVEKGESSIIGNSIIYNYRNDRDKTQLIQLLNKILKYYGIELDIDDKMIRDAYINSLKGNKYNNSSNEPWVSEINDNVNPKMLARRSHTKVKFVCELGHEYETTPDKKSRGDGCPYCSGHRLLKGFNDMQTTHPIMSRDLDVVKSGFKADEVMATSHKRVFWKCQFCGHEWSHSLIKSRVARGTVSKCPNCKTIINE